jgi:hypothetical protein
MQHLEVSGAVVLYIYIGRTVNRFFAYANGFRSQLKIAMRAKVRATRGSIGKQFWLVDFLGFEPRVVKLKLTKG